VIAVINRDKRHAVSCSGEVRAGAEASDQPGAAGEQGAQFGLAATDPGSFSPLGTDTWEMTCVRSPVVSPGTAEASLSLV